MPTILAATNTSVSFVSPLGINMGQAGLAKIIHVLNNVYVASGGVNNSAYQGAPNSSILGNPTVGANYLSVITGGTDGVLTALQDPGGDCTIFTVVQNGGENPAAFVAFSTYGPDTVNPIPGNKGIQLNAAGASGTVTFGDAENQGGSTAQVKVQLTVANVLSGWSCYCVQRGTVGGVTTRNLFNLTASGAVVLASGTSTNTPLHNQQQFMQLGVAPNGGGGLCNESFFSWYSSTVGGGAFFPTTVINSIYLKIKQLMANLPTPINI